MTRASGASVSESLALQVARLEAEASTPRDAHEDMARQDMQRVLDEHLVAYSAPAARLPALRLLAKIAVNVLESPDNPKLRRIKAKNPALQEQVLRVRGGRAFLVAMGFVPKVTDFEEYYQLLPLPESGGEEAVEQARQAQRQRLTTARDLCLDAMVQAEGAGGSS